MSAFGQTYRIPGVYRRPAERVAGFPRVRTDIAGFVGAAGPNHLGEAFAVNDWKGWVSAYRTDAAGRPLAWAAGGALEAAVRDFFANGGRRLWIVNVAERIDAEAADAFLNALLGINDNGGPPQGLELLLRQDEVSLIAIPDFDAVQPLFEDRHVPGDLPADPCFGLCRDRRAAAPAAGLGETQFQSLGPLFDRATVLWAQRYLVERLLRTRWRWFALLAPPAGLDADEVMAWREALTAAADDWDVAALYWPWLLAQDSPGSPTELRSPVGTVAGAFADTDIRQGPQIAPSNRVATGVVRLETEFDEEGHGRVYDAGINVLRDFPGAGIRLWGARTLRWQGSDLSRGDPLAFVNGRRCLSAICRSCDIVGQPLVFEPNDVLNRIKLHQLMTDYLLRVFQSGALLGETPQEGFFVSVDPVDQSPEGQLICRIGVALAVPAEFIVFRIGRQDGVIEQAEAA